MDRRTRLQAVVATETFRAVAFAGILVTVAVLGALVGGDEAVEAGAQTTVSEL